MSRGFRIPDVAPTSVDRDIFQHAHTLDAVAQHNIPISLPPRSKITK